MATKFTFLKPLKCGIASEVWLVKENGSQKVFVLKYIMNVRAAVLENQCLEKVSGKDHFPEYYGYESDNGYYLFKMQYISGKPFAPKATPTFRTLLCQLLTAVGTLHSLGFVHRDIKPNNILVQRTSRKEVKLYLIDFDCADTIPPSYDTGESTVEGTYPFIAPEILEGKPYSFATDMWCIGILMAKVLIGSEVLHALMPRSEPSVCLERINTLLSTLNTTWLLKARKKRRIFDTRAWELMCQLLQLDPCKRPTIAEALQHPFITNK
jgi:serine/threonine protein kinase